MNPEIQNAVEAGKLSTAAGTALERLQPGTYVLHKSWGFGKVGAVDFMVSQMIIDFKTKKAHSMQLQYAAESLQPIPEDHILAKKAANLAAVKTQAKQDAVGLMRTMLGSYGGKATQDQIMQTLVPDVFNETEFKRWWESTKKVLKRDGHFSVPSKKSDPLELREAPVSKTDEYLAAFSNARQLKDLLAALDQLLKNIADFADVSVLQPHIAAAEDQARKNQRLNPSQALEFLVARDELLAKAPNLQPTPDAPTIAQFLRDEERRLPELIGNLPAAKQRHVLHEIPTAFGDEWPSKALAVLARANTRVAAETARLLEERGQLDTLIQALDRAIREHSITSEVLCWLCKERDGAFADLMNLRLLSATVGAMERDQFVETKKDRRLHDLLMNDKELLPDLISGATHEELRDVMRKLMISPVFEELNKRSLLGRVIRLYPEMQAMVSGESDAKQETIVVSWESLEKRKNDYDELVNKKIPENVKEISVARSYGDLRENFEFKAAKEMQRVLGRRRAEMERDLAIARGTDFANPDTVHVSIGTIVTLKSEQGGTETFTILGAWDGDPEKSIVSYKSALAQALMGRTAGETVNLPTEKGERTVEIVKIDAYKLS